MESTVGEVVIMIFCVNMSISFMWMILCQFSFPVSELANLHHCFLKTYALSLCVRCIDLRRNNAKMNLLILFVFNSVVE